MPSQLRLIDYQTFADVILTISYTALYDGALRDAVESQIVNRLTEYAASPGGIGMHRLVSLRHDFPSAFQRLLHGPGTTQNASFDLVPQHFPYFLSGRSLTIAGTSIYLQSRSDAPVGTADLAVTLNGSATGAWSIPPNMPPETTLRSADVTLSGPVLRQWTLNVTAGSLDPAQLNDILLLINYAVG